MSISLLLYELQEPAKASKENKLLKYVKNRQCINLDKIDYDFSLYERDTIENRNRLPLLKENFEKKVLLLDSFQKGKDIWDDIHKSEVYYPSKNVNNNPDVDIPEDDYDLD